MTLYSENIDTYRPTPSPSQRIIQFDLIRVLAIAQVILVHIVSPWIYVVSATDRTSWWLLNAVMSFAKPYVPLFVMVSGALLLNPTKTESLRVFFNKRFSKIAIPFIAWSVFYLFWRAWLIRDIASVG